MPLQESDYGINQVCEQDGEDKYDDDPSSEIHNDERNRKEQEREHYV